MDIREKAHKLNADFKKHGIANPVIAYLLGISAIAPDKDILSAIETGIAPIADYNKNFTSPFPKQAEAMDGELRFAFTENGFPVGLNMNEPHSIVAGASNSGKSVCIQIISGEALKKGHKLWMFVKADDATRIIRIHNDIFYEDFQGKCLQLNPLFFLPMTTFVTLIKDSFSLKDGSEGYLLDSMTELQRKNPCMNMYDLYFFIKAQKIGYGRILGFKESIQNRLGGILSSPLGKIYDCVRGHEADIVKSNAIFNISALTLPEQKFFVNSMIALLYLYNTGGCHASAGS